MVERRRWKNSCRIILSAVFIRRSKSGLSLLSSSLLRSWSLVVIERFKTWRKCSLQHFIWFLWHGSWDDVRHLCQNICRKERCWTTEPDNTFADAVRFDAALDGSKLHGRIMAAEPWCSERLDSCHVLVVDIAEVERRLWSALRPPRTARSTNKWISRKR